MERVSLALAFKNLISVSKLIIIMTLLRLKELRKSLSENESQLRSFEKAAAKSGSTAKTFEKRHSQQAAASAVHAAENSALEKRNAELTALVAEGHKAKAQLEVDRNAKAKRLFELEQVRKIRQKELSDISSILPYFVAHYYSPYRF